MDLIPYRKVEVEGVQFAYREAGEGDPIVFIHGNPTSSYLWRNVQPRLVPYGRTIAIDLLGMGESGGPPTTGADAFGFVQHREYLDKLLAALGVTCRVVLVAHDWGGALAFDWAARHDGLLRGLAYTETIVRPRSFSEEPDDGALFRRLRGPEGEQMVLQDNFFVEELLTAGMLTRLSQVDHDAYRSPWLEPGEARRPMLTFPREIPFDGEPKEVVEIVAAYSRWLQRSRVPKLFVRAAPGAVLTGDVVDFCRSFPAQEEVAVEASHFVPEDAPASLGDALINWITRLH